MGTLGGNICQDIRCWYYRAENNRFPCLRKGGGRCYALAGDNRFHSILGGSVEEGCYAVHPSDTAPALIALKARLRTSQRTIPAGEFFQVGVARTTVLSFDEILLGIELPGPEQGSGSAFSKFALRKSIDFPVVNCAASVAMKEGKIEQARICLNAVHVLPFRPLEAEQSLVGQVLDEKTAGLAGDLALAKARPLTHNGYTVQIAKTLVKRTLLACQS
jgi:xanthine dehydrogenase YagS FAD-binding subunit